MPVFSEEKLLHVLGAQIFMPSVLVFAAAAQKTSLDLMALEARGACIPGSYGTVIIRQTFLSWLPRPRVLTDKRLKHTLSLSLKEAYVLVPELWPDGQASGVAQI